jgi:hypothetical protein
LIKTIGVIPSPRYAHSAVIYGKHMYIFGGYDSDSFSCNDLFQFNFGFFEKLIIRNINMEIHREQK